MNYCYPSLHLVSGRIWSRSCPELKLRILGRDLEDRLIHESREGHDASWRGHIDIGDKFVLVVHTIGLEHLIRAIDIWFVGTIVEPHLVDVVTEVIESLPWRLTSPRYIERILVVRQILGEDQRRQVAVLQIVDVLVHQELLLEWVERRLKQSAG